MPLKLTFAELDEIPEAQRSLYRPRQEGGFILDVEGGAVSKATVDEFRQKNIDLMKRLQAASDVDPEEVATLRAANGQLRADLERARKGSDATARESRERLERQLGEYRTKLERVLIDHEVSRAAAQLGVHPAAIDDVVARVRPRFRLSDDGSPVAVDPAGQTIYGEDGRALSVEGAVRQLTTVAPHLFQSSAGGGATYASASGGRQTHGGPNPWLKESFNATEQARIMKRDRPTAERLAAEAGAKLPE